MAQTVNSSATAYALPTDLTDLRSWVAIADLLEDPATSTALPTRTLSRSAVEAHALVARSLKWASGEIESAMTVGQRYDPLDLQALQASGAVGREMLIGLTCDLAFWWLTKRRKTGARMQDIAGVYDAFEKLDRLKHGENIFSFADSQQAGLPEVSPLDALGDVTVDSVPVTQNASRLFGCRGNRNRWQ